MTASASSLLKDAAELVDGSRSIAHGNRFIAMRNIAALWTAILAAKEARDGSIVLTSLDVANMLEALKIARRYTGAHNLDDYIDGAGYAGIAGEIADFNCSIVKEENTHGR
jgi:hypothetical protein